MNHSKKKGSAASIISKAKRQNLQLLDVSPNSDIVQNLVDQEWIDYKEYLSRRSNNKSISRKAS